MGQYLTNGLLLFCRQPLLQILRKIHFQQIVPGILGKAPHSLRMSVTVGDVGLDVQDRGSVHQVRSADVEHRAHVLSMLYRQKPYAGKTDGVGTERRAGGKYPHPGVSTQPGRPDGGGPVLPHCLGKLPENPKMGKAFNSPQSLGIPVGRLKHNGGLQGLRQTALPGNAKLGGKIAVHHGDDIHGNRVHIRHAPFSKETIWQRTGQAPS